MDIEQITEILESVQEGVIVQDTNGLVVHANIAAAKLLQFQSGNFAKGKSIANLLERYVVMDEHEKIIKTHKLPSKTVLKNKLPVSCNVGLRVKKNNKSRWLSINAVPIFDKANNIQLVACFIKEITENQKTQETINFQQSLLEAENEVSKDGKLIVSPEGRTMWHNQKYLDLWEIPDRNLLNKTEKQRLNVIKEKLKKPKANSAYVHRINASSQAEGADEIELISGKWLGRYTTPLRSKDGKHYGRIWFVHDITEIKESSKKQEAFLGITSHELKTPLSSMKAFNYLIDAAAKKLGDQTIPQYVQKIDQQINKLNNLVKDLVDVSSIRSGRLEINKEMFSFDTFIRDVVEVIRPTTKHKLILVGKTNKYVEADKLRIDELITNIIRNAIKYSPNANKVVINTTHDNKYVLISIKDYGIGIPKRKLKNIFSLFYRATNSSGISGTGLGLYIANEIIKTHQGKITVKSKVGDGSTFTVKLPIKTKA